jgi:hypothetical protein
MKIHPQKVQGMSKQMWTHERKTNTNHNISNEVDSHFFMTLYNNSWWIEHFKVSKSFVFQLSMKLKHLMEKKRHSLQVCCTYTWIWIACSLYKLVPKVRYLHCCQMFAINKLIMHSILREFVYAMNVVFKINSSDLKGTSWPI